LYYPATDGSRSLVSSGLCSDGMRCGPAAPGRARHIPAVQFDLAAGRLHCGQRRENYITIGDRFWMATRARSRLRGQRSLGVPQLRGQIRGDLRLLRRPRLSLAPGARCRLILAAGRSPVPPRDVVGSSWGRSGRTHHHLAFTDGSRAAACSCGNCPLARSGWLGAKLANCRAAEKAGITAIPDRGMRPASPLRHRRS
jgi:hypothetical protein